MKFIANVRTVVLILALLALLSIAAQVEEPTDPDFTNLTEVLTWILYGGGAAIVVNAGVSLLLENFAFWHNLNGQLKYGVVLLLTIGVALLSNYMLNRADIINVLQPYWSIVVLAILGFLSSQITHVKAKSSGYSSSAKHRLLS